MDLGDKSQVCKNVSRKLACLTTENSISFIFKLHNHLRNVNDKAYEPEIIAIGPYHRDKDNLKMMEEHKLHYLKSLLESKNVNIAVYVSAIEEMEQEARNSYAEPISLDAAKFTEMLVLDGCFIIELVRKYSTKQLIKTHDPIFRMMTSLKRDLMLFENQIPFSILCKLFDLIEGPNGHCELIRLALTFFNDVFPGQGCELNVRKSSNEMKHLLELIHICWHPPITMLDMDDNTMSAQRTCRFINSATELRKANVKFKKSESSLFDIRFENGCLLLPPLTIHDGTESIFRNLIAYEKYFGPVGYVTDYTRLLDSLINSSADAELLIHHGIIDNWLGDAQVVSNMISKLRDAVSCSGPNFSYSKIFESVNAHCESISQKLASLTTENSRSFIFKLYDHLRNVNNKAYEPEIIAIGPYHRDKDNLKMMEEHKLRYLKSLLVSKNENIAVYLSAIEVMEQEARNSYAEPINLDAAKFTEMLVLDGCFIIELVRKYSTEELIETDDPIFRRAWMISSLKRDLMLFENQIPFSILRKLFDLIEGPNSHCELIRLALIFFSDMFPGHEGCELSVRKSSNEIKHLLELIHISWHPPPITRLDMDDNTMSTERTWRFINSATELRKANVKFKKSERPLFDIRFENGCLLLPPLIIDDGTESVFRNLMAYEQYFWLVGYVTDYMTVLDCLINSSADVEILSSHGIIDNWMGDAQVVSNMIGKLRDALSSGQNFPYSKIFESVNAHCKRRRNHWMASLMQNYVHNPWAIMSISAAIVLLLLTAAQTVFSILK